jgi:hypothetical protein
MPSAAMAAKVLVKRRVVWTFDGGGGGGQDLGGCWGGGPFVSDGCHAASGSCALHNDGGGRSASVVRARPPRTAALVVLGSRPAGSDEFVPSLLHQVGDAAVVEVFLPEGACPVGGGVRATAVGARGLASITLFRFAGFAGMGVDLD